jgi:hypothetical protein
MTFQQFLAQVAKHVPASASDAADLAATTCVPFHAARQLTTSDSRAAALRTTPVVMRASTGTAQQHCDAAGAAMQHAAPAGTNASTGAAFAQPDAGANAGRPGYYDIFECPPWRAHVLASGATELSEQDVAAGAAELLRCTRLCCRGEGNTWQDALARVRGAHDKR